MGEAPRLRLSVRVNPAVHMVDPRDPLPLESSRGVRLGQVYGSVDEVLDRRSDPLACEVAFAVPEEARGAVAVADVDRIRPLPHSRTQSPVMTSCQPPLNLRSMTLASSSLAGLPRMRPRASTMVSAPTTRPDRCFPATARTFVRAARTAYRGGGSPARQPGSSK